MNYRKINITWNGVKYSCPVNIEMIMEMEDAGANPYHLSADLSKGGIPPFGKISKMLSFIINNAGGDVDPVEIWDSLKTSDDISKVYNLVNEVLAVIFPPSDIEVDGSEKKTGKQ